MANECASVSIKYQGNGQQKLFTFPMTYIEESDIVAFIYNEEFSRWEDQANKFVFANATTIEFFTPPPLPTVDIQNVWIARNTDILQMLKEFFPGSSIRAQDLNDNFDQLRLAIQEGRCSMEDALNDVYTKDEYFTRPDQETGKWSRTGDQMLPATSGAIAARHDALIGDGKPAEITYQQPGKNWQNTSECYTTYWNPEAQAWVAYVNTGPRGIPGVDGQDGADGLQGPPGPTGPRGEKGDGLKVTGYIDQPGPPTFDGTEQGDFVLDSEGHGWFWETDVDPAAWVDTGTIRGPKGDTGDPGTDGIDGVDGVAATIAVGTTTTGTPGTPAQVINTGSSSAAVFNFVIPKGDKGEPGINGQGTVIGITGTLPITVDSTDATQPVIGFDISSLPSLP